MLLTAPLVSNPVLKGVTRSMCQRVTCNPKEVRELEHCHVAGEHRIQGVSHLLVVADIDCSVLTVYVVSPVLVACFLVTETISQSSLYMSPSSFPTGAK